LGSLCFPSFPPMKQAYWKKRGAKVLWIIISLVYHILCFIVVVERQSFKYIPWVYSALHQDHPEAQNWPGAMSRRVSLLHRPVARLPHFTTQKSWAPSQKTRRRWGSPLPWQMAGWLPIQGQQKDFSWTSAHFQVLSHPDQFSTPAQAARTCTSLMSARNSFSRSSTRRSLEPITLHRSRR
jgi:hypothetical protein